MNFNSLNKMFLSDEDIDHAIHKLKTGDPKYKNFSVTEHGQLVYRPKNVIVVKKSQVPIVLHNIYTSDSNSFGKGIVAMYKYIRTKFANITRDEVKEFLQKQPSYQITHKNQTIIKRPIYAYYNNEVWSVDLIDMSAYEGSNKRKAYIFDCIDIFSRKCWIEALHTKEAASTTECLQRIIHRAGIKPLSIRCDRGTEFHGEFKQFCENNNIHLIFSQSHSPTQNAVVERNNKEIRKIIGDIFSTNRNHNWIDFLPDIEEAKNTSYNSTIKSIPNAVWKPTHEKPSRHMLNFPKRLAKLSGDSVLITRAEILSRARKIKQKYEAADNFQEGDLVRVSLSELFANQRKTIKSGNSKQLVVLYSPAVYRIDKVIGSKVGHNKYVLYNEHNIPLENPNGSTKYFKADSLLIVDPNADNETEMTFDKALELNKIEPSTQDVKNIV